jgi:undecaprenyl-diphosphatase
MNLIQAIILGIVQGVTEFAPVSSSAHLVLVPWVFGWPSPSVAFDAILHWGTLTAVLIYFWRDWVRVIKGFFWSLTTRGAWNAQPGGRLADADSRLAWWIIIGTIPAMVLGLAFKDFFESLFSSPPAVGALLLVTALILVLGEQAGRRALERGRDVGQLTLVDTLLVGLAQAAAIAPGISRSGSTISTGLARGLKRDAAARFSFMLGAPIILGAGLLPLLDLIQAGGLRQELPIMVIGFLAAAIAGYVCIKYLLRYLQHGSLYVFAAYCAVIGAATLLLSAFI